MIEYKIVILVKKISQMLPEVKNMIADEGKPQKIGQTEAMAHFTMWIV